MTVLKPELGSLSFRELVASCLSFPTRLIRLKWSSITLDIVKNLRIGQTVIVQCLYSNSWKETVQYFFMSNFNSLTGRTGFSLLRELVASCLSFPTRLLVLETEFYNSRYSEKSEERSDSNSWIVIV